MCKRAVKKSRNQGEKQVSFKTATHLGVLRKPLSKGTISANQIPFLLAEGQNGGGPKRKERRRVARQGNAELALAGGLG